MPSARARGFCACTGAPTAALPARLRVTATRTHEMAFIWCRLWPSLRPKRTAYQTEGTMLRSSTRTIPLCVGLSFVLAGTAVGCGDDDDSPLDRDGSADASEDGGGEREDAGGGDKDSGMDSSTPPRDASMPPGEFMIRGVTGSGDEVADAWLLNATTPRLDWTASDGVQRYEATIFEDDGDTVACESVELVEDEVSTSFPE